MHASAAPRAEHVIRGERTAAIDTCGARPRRLGLDRLDGGSAFRAEPIARQRLLAARRAGPAGHAEVVTLPVFLAGKQVALDQPDRVAQPLRALGRGHR